MNIPFERSYVDVPRDQRGDRATFRLDFNTEDGIAHKVITSDRALLEEVQSILADAFTQICKALDERVDWTKFRRQT